MVSKVFLLPPAQFLRGDLYLVSLWMIFYLVSSFFDDLLEIISVAVNAAAQPLDPRVSADLLQITEHLSGRAETRTQIYRSPSLLVSYPPRIHYQASRRLCLHIQPHGPSEQVKEQGLQKTGKIALTDPSRVSILPFQ